MSRLETALMQVTVGCRPFHANLTALHAGAQRLLNRARYCIVRWSLMFIIPGRLHCFTHRQGSLPTAQIVRAETAMGVGHERTSSWLPSAETTPSLTLQKPGQKYISFCP